MSLVFLLRSAALSSLFAALASAHVLVPFSRQRNHAVLPRSADANSHLVPVAASGHVFVVNVTVGTPPQPLSLLLAPSSPHTWVPQADAMPCLTGYDALAGFSPDDGSTTACRWGALDVPKSSTTKTVEQKFLNFVVAYTDTINVSGVNMTEKLVVGDIEIDDFALGLVTTTSNNQWIGMLGLGNDATTTFPRNSNKYRPNFIDRLVGARKITTQAYSIWLNDAEGDSGNLLLGAIDTSRFEGDLIRLNAAEPLDVFPSAFRVAVANVKIDDKTLAPTAPPLVASLSPAETFSFLPDGLVEDIMAAAGATWNTALERATLPCDAGAKKPKTAIRVQLEGPRGPVLEVRLADLVVPQIVSHWELAFAHLARLPRNTCLLGVQKLRALRSPDKAPHYNIGSALLRRTYLVFDVANKDVALAPVKASSSSPPTILPFATRGARIPSSKLYCAGPDPCVESAQTATSHFELDPESESSSGSGSSGGSSPNTTGSDTSPSSSSNRSKIIIGVAVPLLVLAIAGAIIFLLIRRRRQRRLREAQVQNVFGPTTTLSGTRSTSRVGKESDLDADGTDESSYREDEFGVKVTVSVSAKVQHVKPPSPPELFLGLPGALPVIAEERNSGYWAEGVLRGAGGSASDLSAGGSGNGGGNGSGGLGGSTFGTGGLGITTSDERSGSGGSGSTGRKEIWQEKK
ncbi:putative aspartic protease [Podospora conica]|nr:putative aspartic protease [Schizothecium conicum]